MQISIYFEKIYNVRDIFFFSSKQLVFSYQLEKTVSCCPGLQNIEMTPAIFYYMYYIIISQMTASMTYFSIVNTKNITTAVI